MLSYSLSQFIIKTKITTTKIYFQKNVNINNMDILYYDRIEISEEIDINKTSAMKECDICHYWYFLDKGFTFQPNVCNGCQNVLMMSVNLDNNDISNIQGLKLLLYYQWNW